MSTLRPIHFIIIFLSFLATVSCSYLPEKELVLTFEETADYIIINPPTVETDDAGIIFYPGGLVDPHAYITSFKDLVLADNRTVVILKVTGNLAIWNSKKASTLIEEIPGVKKWVVGGHSLGGSTACIDVFNHPNSFAGLFLLASYSVNDLSDREIPIMSITGSQDQVLEESKFEENKVNLPKELGITAANELSTGGTIGSTVYFNIEGGNHAQFGNYGTQKGDGVASIDPDTQQLIMQEAIRAFLFTNKL